MSDKPWENEPDSLDWTHAGLRCAIRRGPLTGALNGYVGVPAGHPQYGQTPDDDVIEVHGGITYAHEHLPGPGMPPQDGGFWWIGFDCSHADDLIPEIGPFSDEDVYRDIAYVREQAERLAEHLAAIAKARPDQG